MIACNPYNLPNGLLYIKTDISHVNGMVIYTVSQCKSVDDSNHAI